VRNGERQIWMRLAAKIGGIASCQGHIHAKIIAFVETMNNDYKRFFTGEPRGRGQGRK
jgi:hypothetical protein